jgi:hypothetical protein
MASVRQRFSGDGLTLAAVLQPFFESLNWLKYNETKSPVTDRKAIKQYMPMIEAVEVDQANLAFKKTTVMAAFTEVLEASSFKDKMNDAESKDWVTTMDVRFRNLMRCVQQAKLKDAAWFTALRAPQSDAASKSPDLKEYQYGFDSEHWQAWRMTKKGSKEYSDNFIEHLDAMPEDLVKVKFGDDEKEVAGITVKAHQEHTAAAKAGRGNTGSDLKWCSAFQDDELLVKPRKDRQLLMSMYFKKKQICMVKVDLFEEQVFAFDYMVCLAKKVLAKTITMTEVYGVRDEDMSNGTPPGLAKSTASSSETPANSAAKQTSGGKAGKSALKRPAAFVESPGEFGAAQPMKKPAAAHQATAELFAGLPTPNTTPTKHDDEDIAFFSNNKSFPDFLF